MKINSWQDPFEGQKTMKKGMLQEKSGLKIHFSEKNKNLWFRFSRLSIKILLISMVYEMAWILINEK